MISVQLATDVGKFPTPAGSLVCPSEMLLRTWYDPSWQ